jgi:hypothetical protein
LVGVLTAGLLLAGASVCWCNDRDWVITTLDTEGDVGRHADMEIDDDGDLHAVYLRSDDGTLKMVSQEGGVWGMPVVVDDCGAVAGHCDVAPTATGQLPVSYRRDDTTSLWYAGPEVPAVWTTEPITAATDDVGQHLEAVWGPDDELALSFYNSTQEALQHMRRVGGVWEPPATVDPGPERGTYGDLVHRDGVGYAFSYRASGDANLRFADPEISPQAWDVGPLTSETDDVGQYLEMILGPDDELALAFYNSTQEALQHMRRAGGIWEPLETVDPGPDRGTYGDLVHRDGVGYAFSYYAHDNTLLRFADAEILAQDWSVRSVDHHVDLGRQLSMIKGPEGRLDYVYLAYDQWNLGQVRAGEIIPDSVRILSTVADSVATNPDQHVYPDLFVRPGEDWYISFRNDIDGYLYMATAESWQILPQDIVEDPAVGAGDHGPQVPRVLGASPNPSAGLLHIAYYAPEEVAVQLRAVDASGRTVREVRAQSRTGVNVIDLNCSGGPAGGLPAGIYFVQLQVGDSHLEPKKVTVVR